MGCFFLFSVQITQMLGRGGCLGSPRDPQTQRDRGLLRPEPVQGALPGQSRRAVALAAQTPAAPGLLPRAVRDREPGPAFFLFQGAAGRERTASSSLPAAALPALGPRGAELPHLPAPEIPALNWPEQRQNQIFSLRLVPSGCSWDKCNGESKYDIYYSLVH